MSRLTDKQKRFCEEYLVDSNATRAARAAGYSSPDKIAAEIKRMPEVRKYLARAGAKQRDRLEVSAKRVLDELAKIAFHDVGDYYKKNQHGKEILKNLDEMTPDQRAAIAEYDPSNGYIKLYSKDPSLDKLGKYLKLFTELHETQHTFTLMGDVVINGVPLDFNVGTPKKK